MESSWRLVKKSETSLLTHHWLSVKPTIRVEPAVRIVVKMTEVILTSKTQSHTEIAVAEPGCIGIAWTVIRRGISQAGRTGGAAANRNQCSERSEIGQCPKGAKKTETADCRHTQSQRLLRKAGPIRWAADHRHYEASSRRSLQLLHA